MWESVRDDPGHYDGQGPPGGCLLSPHLYCPPPHHLSPDCRDPMPVLLPPVLPNALTHVLPLYGRDPMPALLPPVLPNALTHVLSLHCRDPMPAEKKMMQQACSQMAGKAANSV